MKLLAAMLLTTSLMAATSSGATGSPADVVRISATAAKFGIAWSSLSSAGLIVRVADLDGTRDTYSWPADEQPSPDALSGVKDCLEKLRWFVRVASPEQVSQPHFVHRAAIECFESAGLSGSVETHDPDALEYTVGLSTGNLNESHSREPGTRVSASGGPFLGALRIIRSDHTDSVTVIKDLRECRDEATVHGVFTDSRSSSVADSAGLQITYSATSIQPMVERFDQCLKNRNYVVQPLEKGGTDGNP